MFKPSRILVPTDMSEHSTRALRQAFDIARHFNSEVFFLHVIQDPVRQCTIDFCIDDELFNQLQTRMFESVRHEVRKQLALFPGIDPNSVTIIIKTGTPHDEIIKAVKENSIDLIVMASLGADGLTRYLMGGVARHVIQGAGCSVLLTK